MKVTVVSYSLTGNNEALATRLASKLGAEHVRITEARPRTTGTIAADMMLGRTPKVDQGLGELGDRDLVVLVGPVWMGHVAAPLRACLRQLRGWPGRYAWCSISGGADGPNLKLADELERRVGRAPAAVVDMHIADLLPAGPRPTREDTSTYRLSVRDVESLAQAMVMRMQDSGAIGGIEAQRMPCPERTGLGTPVIARGEP